MPAARQGAATRPENTPENMTTPAHPQQPIVTDDSGTARFKENAIVRFLLDDGPNDMNRLARMPFSAEDRRQFAQLIGYSVSGYEELSYSLPLNSAPPEASLPPSEQRK